MNEKTQHFAKRWMHEVWNERKESTIDELTSPDCLGHIEGGDVVGTEPFKKHRAALFGAFPDLHVEVEDTLSDENAVVVRWRATGTHRGDHLGVPATQRRVDFRGMTWMRIVGGRMVEGWDSWNVGGLIESLRTPAKG